MSERSGQTCEGRAGLVVAGHPEAAQLGADVLASGGTAMDAAVTVSFALGVAEPYGSGVGGKLLLLHQRRGDQAPEILDGMDIAPQGFSASAYRSLPRETRRHSWASVCVPGMLPALGEGHARWGRLAWDRLVEPVAALAERGSEVLAGGRVLIAEAAYRLRDPELRAWLLPGGRLPDVGQRLPSPAHAAFLRRLSADGPAYFQGPDILHRVTAASSGLLSAGGFRFEVKRPRPIPMRLPSGATLWAPPPPAMGGVLVQAFLRGGVQRPTRADVVALDAYGRRYRRLDAYARSQLDDTEQAFGLAEALVHAPPEGPLDRRLHVLDAAGIEEEPEASTTHFVVVDRDETVISATQSLSHHFGAGVSIPGTNVIMNNSLTNFSYGDGAPANRPAAGTRPRSTMAPMMVCDENMRPCVAIGLPGGARIPSSLVQVLSDWWSGTDMARAIEAPRWHPVRPIRAGAPSLVWDPEHAPDPQVMTALRARGWCFGRTPDPEAFGGVTALVRNADGTWTGYADSRRTNHACAVQ